ncbi:polyadenylate-binding protein-interacting protein 1 [Dermatophagoides farinae]|uniref:Paf1 complex component n=1 Tax=Dermatophagoides farinae TaxID=6954 RepID=A0A922HS36_DERFA|nr:polyadenylate-binding protein-interacting protein 1-like [Dermatophagoides farinae]XP_046920260.1 polyadenylate-binding protein-interacting protein 1-like [Dermatophagoides farinae]XP_046920261.1 polyadenylate-binding protein-interacting protein 1-like [Dermatophagoides farinae]KAH7640180.1 hypothetical protein HUG17_10660 [Dermatophagoides farinae]KAH9506657.1 Paf1 complex component [Dermatophagoides farinae]KAH9506658.1 Paf1 complex component, variant 2 [Dermatophagoides farinae]
MENNHLSSNTNNSISHSVTELGDRLNLLNVNERNEQQLNASSRSLPSNYVDISLHNLSSRSNSSPNNSIVTPQTQFSKLNPSAQEFVPRSNRTTNANPTMAAIVGGNGGVPYRTINQVSNAPISNSNNHNNNNHNYATNGGPNANTAALHENENYIEDYMSLSYLKDFINHISNKPSMYDQGINELTLILNSYLDEDDCVLELIVNQIVDQSIIDVNFRYNGVRLCDHFMEHLREASSGQSFKQLLFKRNQRECSRKVSDITSANTFVHLRGLALFTAELYSRCNAPDLAEHLPSLLMNILSSDIKRDDNVKCVCHVLKLCGQQMQAYFASKGKTDFTIVLGRLKETLKCDMSTSIKEMVKKILTLVENDWQQPQTVNTSNIVNPYLNNPQGIIIGAGGDGHHYSDRINNHQYDFGNCGDENNAEICQDFENFLKSTRQN